MLLAAGANPALLNNVRTAFEDTSREGAGPAGRGYSTWETQACLRRADTERIW